MGKDSVPLFWKMLPAQVHLTGAKQDRAAKAQPNTPFLRCPAGTGLWGGNGAPRAHISGVAYSGALILMPSFRRLQKSSSICTPG